MIIQELAAKLGLEIDEGAFEIGHKMIEGLEKGLLGLGVALGAYVGGMQAILRSTAAAASAARRTAQQTGTTAESIQELHFAAEASGVSAEELDHALMKLSRSAYDASQGSQEAADTWAALGVSIYDSRGQLKSTDSLLQDVSAKFADLPDGIKKTALAQKVFGRSGAELLPFLNKSGDGIEKLREEAHEFGVVLDGETIAAAREFKLANHELEASMEGLKYAIGGPLIKGAGDLAKAFGEFVRHNRPLIAGIIRRPYELLRDSVKWLGKNLWAAKLALVAFTSYMIVAHAPAMAAAVASVIAWAQGLTWAGVAAKAAGLASAAAGALATAAWIAGIALAILLLDEFYTLAQGGDTLIGRLGKAIDEWWDKGGDWKQSGWKDFEDFLMSILYTVTHIGETIENWGSFLTKGGSTGKGKLGDLAEWAFGPAPWQQAQQEAAARAAYSNYQPPADWLATGGASSWSPGALSPTAAAGAGGPSGGAPMVNAPSFQATIAVQAGPGMNERALARETVDAFGDWYNDLQQSVPAVVPNN